MKKLFLTLGAVLAFGIASAQTDTTSPTSANKTDKKKPQTQRDTRTDAQKTRAAQKNINDLEQNTNAISPSMQVQPALNPNSSAMPQYTPPVSPIPPGAPTSPTDPTSPTPAVPNTPKQ